MTPSRFLQFPLIRLVLGIAWVLLVVIVVQILLALVIPLSVPALNLVGALVVAAAALGAYAAFVGLVERRAPVELAPGPAPAELGLGIIVGALLFSATIGFIALLGYYRILSFNSWSAANFALADSLVA